MKKKLLIPAIITVVVFASCKNDSSKSDTQKDSTQMHYAYSKQVEWDWGSNENLQTALNSLKAFEDNDMAACMKTMGDTVYLQFDSLDQRMPHDSVAAMLGQVRAANKSLKILMDDYESVRSKDGKIEFVSIWYKEITEDMKGKVDSLDIMNDLKFSNGKIIGITERTRHYQPKKN